MRSNRLDPELLINIAFESDFFEILREVTNMQVLRMALRCLQAYRLSHLVLSCAARMEDSTAGSRDVWLD